MLRTNTLYVVVVVFIDLYYKVTKTCIAIEDLSVLKEEVYNTMSLVVFV